MPVRPENKGRYPKDWKETRARILLRAAKDNVAGWPRCEGCGVPNHSVGYRDEQGNFVDTAGIMEPPNGERIIKIVLTIAHLDYDDLEHATDDRLRAWCQKCHNSYDAPMRAAGIKARRREKKALGDLFQGAMHDANTIP